MKNEQGFSDGFWLFVTMVVVSIILATMIERIQPVSFEMSGTWNGDISINKNDPHWGVSLPDGTLLDKSTSLQVTGVTFYVKGTAPLVLVNQMFKNIG